MLGIKTFMNYTAYTRLFDSSNQWIRILSRIFPEILGLGVMTCIVSAIRKKTRGKEWVKNLYVLLVYSLGTIIVMFPIADSGHFGVGSICTYIMGIYIIYIMILYIVNHTKKKEKGIAFIIKTFFEAVSVLIFLVYIAGSCKSLITFAKETEGKNYLNHFKYIETNENLYKKITYIGNYIKLQEKYGKDVIMLDSLAAPVNIPIDKYYKDYDMFNLGNLGTKAEERNNR